MTPINTIIADDHPLIREGLTHYFNHSQEINLIATAKDGDELMHFMKAYSKTIDIVIIDYNMPNLSGAKLIQSIKNSYPDIKILILSSSKNLKQIIECLQNGAIGYILKEETNAQIANAIKMAHKNKEYFSTEVSQLLGTYFIRSNKTENKLTLDISKRELEILKLTAKGLTNYEIGDELNISFRTVDTHKRNMLKKVGAKNIVHLVSMAHEMNML